MEERLFANSPQAPRLPSSRYLSLPVLTLALVYRALRSAPLNYLIWRLVFLNALSKSISGLFNNISSLASPQKAERLEKAITNEQAVRCHHNSVRYIA